MKLKTHQAAAKKFKITRRGKILKRSAGQAHFNSRDPGRITMRKRRDRNVTRADARALRTLLPYARIKPSANREF